MKILLRIVLAFLLIGLGLLTYAFLIEPARLVVNQYEIRLKKWDKELDGLRVVMISDIHGGSNFIDEEKIRTIVKRANEQDADLVLLLGDFVAKDMFQGSKLKMPVKNIADSLQGLKAKYGVYAILGNQDSRYDYGIVKAEFERIGYQVFDDKTALIKTGKGEFWLAGFRDVLNFTGRREYSNYAKDVLKETGTSDRKIIAITHNPDVVMMITDNREGQYKVSDNIAVLLGGHTHGGQVNLPWYGAPMVSSSFGYTGGHVVEGGMDVFITTGIGTSVIPVRFGVPPEIAVLTIRSEEN